MAQNTLKDHLGLLQREDRRHGSNLLLYIYIQVALFAYLQRVPAARKLHCAKH